MKVVTEYLASVLGKRKKHQLSAAVRIPTVPPLSHIEGIFL